MNNLEKGDSGTTVRNDSYFFISAYDETVIKGLVKGIMQASSVSYGARISDVEIREAEALSDQESFAAARPFSIKRRFDDYDKHITYNEERSGQFLTDTLRKKLEDAGLSSENVNIDFDKNCPAAQTNIVLYKQVANRANICSIIIKGTHEQIAFAWNFGVEDSTGIGFGTTPY